MPELPEVEALRLGLKNKIINYKIKEIEVLKPKLIAGYGTKRKASSSKTKLFKESILNKKILSIKRIAKNLILELDDKSVLIIHLKMTGQLVFVDKKKNKTLGGHPIIESYKETLPNKHTAIIFTLDNGILYYNDVRMFGYVLFYKNLEEARKKKHFENLGLDPFQKEFTLDYFREALKKKNKNIKAILLEQSIVTGCGNIYTDEICFASKILPTRIAKSLTNKEIENIYKNLKIILKNAIKEGGSSVSNYLLADGSKGNYTRNHKVYGRAGKKCKVCKNILEKNIIAGRSTVYCKVCQR